MPCNSFLTLVIGCIEPSSISLTGIVVSRCSFFNASSISLFKISFSKIDILFSAVFWFPFEGASWFQLILTFPLEGASRFQLILTFPLEWASLFQLILAFPPEGTSRFQLILTFPERKITKNRIIFLSLQKNR